MKLRNRQRGLGFAGWLFLILLFGGGLTVGLKLVPVYSDNRTMEGILDGLAAEDGMAAKHPNLLYEMLDKRFKINNIRDFSVKDNIVIKRDPQSVRVIMEYQVRMPLISNLDLVASFRKEVQLH